MDWNISIWIAIVALTLSVVSFVWNWRHSETLFRRQEYPAVAWHFPKISRKGENTNVATSICNHGPRKVCHVFVSALLCKGFRVEAWCKSSVISEIPIGEPLDLVLTKELERDIDERFGGLLYYNGWRFKGKPCRYKIAISLKYQPLIADANPIARKTYCLLRPVIKNDVIDNWETEWIPNWQGWLPRFWEL